jgi:hypothetical protein
VSVFPPIADYGLLSNCEQCCLIAPDGGPPRESWRP